MLLKDYLENQKLAIFGGYIDIFMGYIKKKVGQSCTLARMPSLKIQILNWL